MGEALGLVVGVADALAVELAEEVGLADADADAEATGVADLEGVTEAVGVAAALLGVVVEVTCVDGVGLAVALSKARARLVWVVVIPVCLISLLTGTAKSVLVSYFPAFTGEHALNVFLGLFLVSFACHTMVRCVHHLPLEPLL